MSSTEHERAVNNKDAISVIGLGKLGGSMAACFASRGYRVIGVDINQKAVDAINSGRAPVQETGLGELVAANVERLRATTSTSEAVRDSHISFVIVPTPSDERGSFSLEYAKFAFRELGRALAEKDDYHVIVMTSTVLPGATRHGLLPVLEEASGKVCGKDFGLCYNPEFIALGSVIRDFLNPDFYLLGEFDTRSGDALAAIHSEVSENKAPIKRLSLENAELAKVAVNSFVTMKISFANMLAEFCEQYPGGDVDEVSDALGLDQRIGRKYLTGGMGFAGPCFPRDNLALDFMGKTLGVDSSLLRANHDYNNTRTRHLAERIEQHLFKGASVAVLGLAYKPLSHIIEAAPGVQLCSILGDKGYRVIGHDPLACDEASSVLKYRALVTDDLAAALRDADIVVVTTPDDEYRNLTLEQLVGGEKPVTLIDCWRMLGHLQSSDKIRYVPVGQAPAGAASKVSDIW